VLKTNFMKKEILASVYFTLVSIGIFAQNDGTIITGFSNHAQTRDASAVLEGFSDNQGFLAPRLTLAQRAAIVSPATSLLIFQTDNTPGYYYNAGTPAAPIWERLTVSSGVLTGAGAATRVAFWSGASTLSSNSNLFWDNTNSRLGIGTASPLAKLHVTGTGAVNGLRIDDADIYDEGSWLRINHNGTQTWIGEGDAYINFGDASGARAYYFRDNVSAIKAMINSAGSGYFAGNVGIGMTSVPGSRMEVVGDALTLSGANLDMNRDAYPRNGISWYSKTYPSWSTYMAQAGQTSVGPHGDLTAPAGTYVNSWALRNYIENFAGYGWTFESAANTTTPAVRFEIRASDGLFHAYGAGVVDGTLTIGGGSPAANRVLISSNAAGLAAWADQSTLAANYANLTGIPVRTSWVGVHRNFVAEQLSWKNYGNNHTIFDASASTSPQGTAVNNTNAQIPWTASYPTLMGWNGTNTYGVRVDMARYAETAGSAPGDNLGNHTATTTLNMNGQSITNATGLSFSNANPYITASSYFVAPGGAYFNSGTVYTEAAIQARGGINNDAGSFGGNVSITDDLRIHGVITGIQGSYPTNNAIRLTPNFHLNTAAGYATIVNWDNGAVGGGTQQFRVGNGSGVDQFYVRADGATFGRLWYDLDDSGYYLDATSASNAALRIRGGALHGPNPTWGAYMLVGGDGRQGYVDNGSTASVGATNGNLHADAASGYDLFLNYYDGNSIHFGRGNNSTRATLDGNGLYLYDGWLRPHGAAGLYFQSYGGGWNMEDGTWLRTYGARPILATGGLAGYGNNAFAGTYGTNPRIWGSYDNVTAGGIMISDDGGFFDYNDAWIQYRGSTGLKIVSDNGSWDMIFSMCLTNGGCTYDKRVATESNAWGLLGASGNAWWQSWAYSFNNASERELKKDIIPVKGSVGDIVMADLDKMTPYLYRYNEEVDEWSEQNYAKYRTGLHMGLILDETPDYIQSQSYNGVDIYAVATLGVAASKHNREEIKQIKQSIGLSEQTMTIQDFGSAQLNAKEVFISFDADFAAKLGASLPVVTVTSNDPSVTLSVTYKSASGFKVVSSVAKPVTFDYIAMAKVKNTLVHAKEEISAETMSRIKVDQSSKDKVIQYWKDEPKREEERVAKAKQEAVVVQKQRAAEIFGHKGDGDGSSVDVHPSRPETVAPSAEERGAEEIPFVPTIVMDPKDAQNYDSKVEDASPNGDSPTQEKHGQREPQR
jgi:hypothetical protein